jgi:dimethylhistidine N-methyltransferase
MQEFAQTISRGSSEFLEEVLDGLSRPQKSLPCRFFYDERGSELFEQITQLPEYYPTRTEIALLKSSSDHLKSALPPHATIVEFGSGSSRKTELLLDALENPRAYIPIEISASALYPAAERISRKFPDVNVYPVLAGFHNLSQLRLSSGPPYVGFFPGSTIGNFTSRQAVTFMRSVRTLLGPSSFFLAGADLQKPLDVLLPAYDDAQGVTAAFNLNILSRINRELRGTFVPELFRHRALYNEAEGRIEMHLEAQRAHRVSVGPRAFEFRAGETIHTENSYKYTVPQFDALARDGGWRVAHNFIDSMGLFSLNLLA